MSFLSGRFKQVLLYGKYSKIMNTKFFFCSQIKCALSRLEFIKCLSEDPTDETLIKLLLQKNSDQCLHSLSMPILYATSVKNVRTSFYII